jgi:hypothetical protein
VTLECLALDSVSRWQSLLQSTLVVIQAAKLQRAQNPGISHRLHRREGVQDRGTRPCISQDEDNPAARKRRRLEEPLPTTTDEAARKTASPDLSVGLPLPATADGNDADADPVSDTQPAARKTAPTDVSVALPPPVVDNDDANVDSMTDETARATGRWTTDQDAKLICAVANTSKKKWGNDYKTDWDAVAEYLFPIALLQTNVSYLIILLYRTIFTKMTRIVSDSTR